MIPTFNSIPPKLLIPYLFKGPSIPVCKATDVFPYEVCYNKVM